LLHLIPVSPLELNLKSLASAHTSAIQPEMASCKCLDRLPIHAVMVLAHARRTPRSILSVQFVFLQMGPMS
jgi:hypothetical protein